MISRPRVLLGVAFVAVALGASACTPAAPDVPAAELPVLDAELAGRFARLSLDCVERPYPHKSDLIQDDAADVRPHADVTPAFYGCFDWHSAVHGHWAMLALLRRFPALPEAPRIRAILLAHLAPGPLAAELAIFGRTSSRTFERPYGWGWLLRLASELERWNDPEAPRLREALQPLVRHLAGASADYLGRLSVPVRAGTHNNTAYAISHLLAGARALGDEAFATLLVRRARAFYLGDRACPVAYEPSGEDFLSPCLAEADLMRQALSPAEFLPWLDGFLPAPSDPAFATLLAPPEVKDRHDPRIGHLIGLSFHRAAAFQGLAGALPSDDPRRDVFLRLAARHAIEALTQMNDSGYGGEHWLATFAIAALSATSP